MAFTSASGTAFVILTAVLASLIITGAKADPVTTTAPTATLQITVTQLRNDSGTLRVAVCPENSGFPNCREIASRTATVRIVNRAAHVNFTGLPHGIYAVSVFHDFNNNGKLDTFVGIPREGYGFSNNPPFRPRAPTFAEAAISISGDTTSAIRMRYVL